MAQQAVTIPAELIDNIVDEVAQDPDFISRRQSLKSLALSSWALRHRAHKHTFADIYLCGMDTYLQSANPRIHFLLELLEMEQYSTLPGIASYIKSLNVYMTGPECMVRPTLDDGTLASILRRIFRSGEPSGGPRTLSLTLGIHGQPGMTFNWSSFNEDFQDAFRTLCRNPLFTTLHLSRFNNVPRDIFRHATLKNVNMSEISLVGENLLLDAPDVAGAQPEVDSDRRLAGWEPSVGEEGEVVLLESINVDHSFSLVDVLDITQSRRAHIVYSRLKDLTVRINHVAQYERTASILEGAAASLQNLDVNLRCKEPGSLELCRLSNLVNLTISHVSTSYKGAEWSCMPQICHLLRQPHFPPSLQKITLNILLYTNLSDKSPKDIVQDYPYALLDDLFSHRRFDTLQHVVLVFSFNLYVYEKDQLDEGAFAREASVHVRKAFPEVNNRAKFRFDVVIDPKFYRYSK
ncbi:hypothetical protein CPC08DRAFT_224182 [Agrocybe pediades]|nr:hypothetical protein CPC08DRAFT_224182 [Agrocybe pediades]